MAKIFLFLLFSLLDKTVAIPAVFCMGITKLILYSYNHHEDQACTSSIDFNNFTHLYYVNYSDHPSHTGNYSMYLSYEHC